MTSMARLARQVNTLCTRSRPSTDILFSHRHRHQIYAFGLCRRSFVTHQDAASSLLSSALDQKQRGTRPNREDSVGPFALGISQGSLKGKKVKQWSELSTGGKVIRTTQRTSNLAVILLGAGLSAVLIYALTSELFSKNSPTVLFNDACDRINASPRVAKYLRAPLIFHNNPPSSTRPRHRHRHVSSQVAVDSSGREHMLLNFYVQGSSSAKSAQQADEETGPSYIESLSSLTLDETIGLAKEKLESIGRSAKRAFRYLSGDVTPLPAPHPQLSTNDRQENERKQEKGVWSVAGLFSGLKGRRSVAEGAGDSGVPWTEGEVHADLVLNDDGYFVFRYLLIDIPHSETRNPVRVFVERAPGVRENEPIMRFTSA
ncbi:TIM21-domain-containing protein [Suillus fuscotomentosus]|uniref:Mitochondrial import inner membrane translocase subunit Tim21 n=1 Tax=Suillus fuscotomentosus TaxID=1912939 RepID=A0AAD4EGY5_9AGAM|nr:TIM21-domain-containing protein [Suillus fuscotomentosus]KAG1904819.1 TIM21-domain-containing protein [Suillus fuscotomentosus]